MAKQTAQPRAKLTPEERAAKFRETASKRTNKVLRALEGLQQTANARRYVYTADQVNVILDAIMAKAKTVQAAFQAGGGPAREEFTL